MRPEYDEDYNKEDDNSPDPVCPCGEVVGAFDNYKIDGQAVCKSCYQQQAAEAAYYERS